MVDLTPPTRPVDAVRLHDWLERLATEWAQPGHGRLGRRVALLRAHRDGLEVAGWVHRHPWHNYEDEQLIELTEDYLQRRFLAEAAWGLPDTWQPRFAVPDAAWPLLKWDLMCVTTSPPRQAMLLTQLHVLWPRVWDELELRGSARHGPSFKALLAMLALPGITPSTAEGLALSRRTFPPSDSLAGAIGDETCQALRKMAWQHLPPSAQAWLIGEHSIIPMLDGALWESLAELGHGHTVPELIRMALRGDLNVILDRMASRVQDVYDREHPSREIMVSQTRVESPPDPDSAEPILETIELRFNQADTAMTWRDDWVDVDRASVEVARDPHLRRGLAVLRDLDLLGEDWETLIRRYGKAKSTLQAWRAEAVAALRRRRPRS